MIEIAGRAKVYGIFGDPVAHSLSPAMQNAAIADAQIDAVYVPFHVTPETLPAAVAGMRALQLGGVNITVPHKQTIMPLLDRIDEDANLIGAVNTVVMRGSELVGYNTDGLGFVRSLHEDLGFAPIGKRVLLLGAGGACRAAAVSLLRSGVAKITLVNRNLARAEQLASSIESVFSEQEISAYSLRDAGFLYDLTQADLVVNTTSVGLKGEALTICPTEKIKSSASVYDMVYSAVGTPFVAEAKSHGLSAVDGIGMLIAQGEEAFFHWFGVRPKVGLMRNCLNHIRTVNHS